MSGNRFRPHVRWGFDPEASLDGFRATDDGFRSRAGYGRRAIRGFQTLAGDPRHCCHTCRAETNDFLGIVSGWFPLGIRCTPSLGF